jgi:hypothetical protein
VSAVLHHALLALAVVGLAEASLRLASLAAPRGLERVITAVVAGVSLAIVEALLLGLLGLGSNTIALAGAAGLAWAGAVALLPAPRIRPRAELEGWWRRLTWSRRATAATLGGMAMAWIAWQLRNPSIGFDSGLYHYAQVAGWIHNGRPGSILFLSYDLPYGNYPLTDEVAMTWAAGISRSFTPLALWNPAMLLLLAIAGWATLRNLDVRPAAAGLGTASLVTLPLVVHQLNEPQTDLPALTWLACTAALSTAARRTPPLLAPALVAGGLSIGTKTTPAPLVVISLVVGLYLARGRLRALGRWLVLAAGTALAVGGIWYVRNLLQHGSPLWPFVAAPWGDPRPPFLELVDTRLLERPAATLSGRWSVYSDQLAGAVVLLAGALLVLVRAALGLGLERRLRLELAVAGLVAVVAFGAWTIAPGTGLPTSPQLLFPETWPASTVRYLLPALGAATVAVALAARVEGVSGTAATFALGVAVGWNLVQDAQLGLPYVPPARALALGAAAGLLVLMVAGAVSTKWSTRAWPRSAVANATTVIGGAVLVGVGLAIVSEGFVERHARVEGSTALGQGVAAWFVAQPDFDSDPMTIAFASRALQAPLAGDHFTNRLELLAAHVDCARVQARARHSAVVVTDPAFLRGLLGDRPYDAGRCLAGRRPAYRDEAFSVYAPDAP